MADRRDHATHACRCIHSTVGSVRIWYDQLAKFAFSLFGIRTNTDDSSLSASAAIGKMIGRQTGVSPANQWSAKSNQEILRHLVRLVTVLNSAPPPGGEKALLARHWRACLGAPASQTRAGARSRDWGEGTGRCHTRDWIAWLRSYPHPPLRGTFSRREKGTAMQGCVIFYVRRFEARARRCAPHWERSAPTARSHPAPPPPPWRPHPPIPRRLRPAAIPVSATGCRAGWPA